MLTLIVGLAGAVLALWQEIRRRSAATQRDEARAALATSREAHAAAQEAHSRSERVVALYRSEITTCEEALRASDDRDAVRERLRRLLAGPDPTDED